MNPLPSKFEEVRRKGLRCTSYRAGSWCSDRRRSGCFAPGRRKEAGGTIVRARAIREFVRKTQLGGQVERTTARGGGEELELRRKYESGQNRRIDGVTC